MDISSPCCYEVRHLDGQGNGLFATRDIKKGELIFQEFPFVWNGFKAAINAQSLFCYTCGECIASLHAATRCEGCQVRFCSRKCRSATNAKGHAIICACYKQGRLVDRFSQTNQSGHLALALQCYMHIAKTSVSVLVESQESVHSRVTRCAKMVLGGYYKVDYCRTNHAVRTGRSTAPDQEMFESMIAPAYFATHLEDGLASIHEVFAGLPLSMWSHQGYSAEVLNISKSDSCDSVGGTRVSSDVEAAQLREAFLSSSQDGIFSPMFFRYLMGMFVVNSYHTHLESKEEPSVQLMGTALYPTVSKLNHSCESNIVNSHSMTDVQLYVYATADILKGQELTTTYLHSRPAHAKPQSRRSRHKCMLQYLFTCTCPKCKKKRLLAQSIRRAKRGDPNTDNADSEYSDDEEGESSSSEE